jgi:hypothetical protein
LCESSGSEKDKCEEKQGRSEGGPTADWLRENSEPRAPAVWTEGTVQFGLHEKGHIAVYP